MARTDKTEIKEAVIRRYTEVARSGTHCCGTECCPPGASTCGPAPLYTQNEVASLPAQALGASAGCGNPATLASLKPGETVVDLGSGGGIDCFLAAQEVGPEGRVIGVDMTPEMVELARRNAAELESANVEFRLGEIDSIPMADGLADVVISNCVINLAADKRAVFREVFRILRPGGRVMVSDVVLTEERPEGAASDLDSWAACLGGAEPRSAYLQWLGEAGFVEVEVVSESPASHAGDWMDSFRSVDVRAHKPS